MTPILLLHVTISYSTWLSLFLSMFVCQSVCLSSINQSINLSIYQSINICYIINSWQRSNWVYIVNVGYYYRFHWRLTSLTDFHCPTWIQRPDLYLMKELQRRRSTLNKSTVYWLNIKYTIQLTFDIVLLPRTCQAQKCTFTSRRPRCNSKCVPLYENVP